MNKIIEFRIIIKGKI